MASKPLKEHEGPTPREGLKGCPPRPYDWDDEGHCEKVSILKLDPVIRLMAREWYPALGHPSDEPRPARGSLLIPAVVAYHDRGGQVSAIEYAGAFIAAVYEILDEGISPAGVGPAQGPLRRAKPLKARITMEFNDFMRRALNHHYGLPGKASLKDCKLWMETTITSTWPHLANEYADDTGCGPDE